MMGSLAVVVLVGCHPRYEYEMRGTGGSGSLDSIRARILVLIAGGEYEHAREYLELATDFSEAEHDKLEQMISAAERRLTPFLDGAVQHIFRQESGHFPVDTAEARELIQSTVSEDNYVGLRRFGNRVYQRILEGVQIWVHVKDGTIRDAGRNPEPRTPETLLQ
jgi:hypothetical protein